MSVSKWKWTPECDHGICIGDCDLCDKAVPVFGEWVPVEKRLPEENCSVLVTFITNGATSVGIMYTMHWNIYDDKIEWMDKEGLTPDKVIAWMPLPEPYKIQNDKES